jgi:putative DNA primase/helicase
VRTANQRTFDIDVTGKVTERLAPEAWAALRRANVPARLFVRGGNATAIDRDENSLPMVRDVGMARLKLELGRAARWFSRETGRRKQIDPPGALASNMLADPEKPLPPLRRLVNAPVFAPDGALVMTGYNPSSGIYYFDDGLVVPQLSASPSDQDLERARSLVFDELLGDFPFVDDAARAHALAFMILPFVRSLIKSPTPLHLVEKPTPGTGAGLLVTVATIPVLGKGAPVMTEGRDEDEWRKRLTAVLLGMPSVVLIDNLRDTLDSAAVSAALTATEWEDRLLGQSKMIRVPISCTWVATGNNPALSNEMTRRCVSIRLDPKADRPWTRTAFKHANLIEWAIENRGRLVWACLTMVNRWMAAGQPAGRLTLGTYEEWSRVMGGILDACGVPGFLSNLQLFYERADTEGQSWRTFVEEWWAKFEAAPISASDLIVGLWDPSGLGPLDLRGNEKGRPTALGIALRKKLGRVFERWSIEEGGRVKGRQLWRLAPAEAVPLDETSVGRTA